MCISKGFQIHTVHWYEVLISMKTNELILTFLQIIFNEHALLHHVIKLSSISI